MSCFGSLHQAKGGIFTNQLLYVQHVDKEKDTASRISEQSLHEYLLNNSKIFSDTNFAEYLRNPKANLGILKSALQDEIVFGAAVCTNPLPATPKTAVTIHAFVVFMTENLKTKNGMWYSMEKNGRYIVLQQSPKMYDVMYKLYDPEEKKLVKRLGSVKRESFARGNEKELEYLIRAIWKTNQLSTKYNLLFSNCQNFAKFVFKEASYGGMKWSTWISAFVDRIGLSNKKSQTEIEADTLKYNRRKDAKFAYYEAMAEGRRQDFEELAKNNLTTEMLNSVDSQGYTLLEWATVFSTSDWPIDQFLIEKGAEIQTDDEGKIRRNVFFIALQYLPSKKESRYLSFDGINIHGVNQTDDTALPLALNGEKWDVAERILDQFPDYDVNATNTLGYTPLHLAVHPKCKMDLIKKILARMNSKSVNAQNERGWTALHNAIDNQSEIVVKELLKHKDVDVNLKNNNNVTALHYAAGWKNMPRNLFTKILEKSTDVNAQDKGGHTALHYACCLWKNIPRNLFTKILEKSADVNAQDKGGDTALHWAIIGENKTAVEELLKRDDVDVNLRNNNNYIALHNACLWKNMPIDLFKIILEKTTDVNAQQKDGHAALHGAISEENETVVGELLKCKDVDFNIKNNNNQTALNFASSWKNIPVEMFRVILETTTDVNAQEKDGWTALEDAIRSESEIAVKEMLKRKDVDVNLKNKYNHTALHYAILWKNMPIELFKIILEKLTDINAQDENGNTALHWAIGQENRNAVEELLKRDDVNVNLKNNQNLTALHVASVWVDIPIDLFRVILEKSTDVNAQERDGNTALHLAIMYKSATALKELLKCKEIDFNLNNNKNQTARFLASLWEDMPIDLLSIFLEK